MTLVVTDDNDRLRVAFFVDIDYSAKRDHDFGNSDSITNENTALGWNRYARGTICSAPKVVRARNIFPSPMDQSERAIFFVIPKILLHVKG